MKKIIVIGGGIAGLTAAAYLSQKHRVIVLEKEGSLGGLIGSFTRGKITFDKGIRAIENSGTVLPMLKNLGINLKFDKSDVTIGVESNAARLVGENSLTTYQNMLKEVFPEEVESIDQIINKIIKISHYMQILYGVDNPLFLDPKKDFKYFIKTIIPWMFKYAMTVKKIDKLNMPIIDYLSSMTDNRELVDALSQHFFPDTPTSFALSYFSMLNDYYYPKGGMQELVKALKDYILNNKGEILLNHEVTKLDVRKKIAYANGIGYIYDKAVWAGDLKKMYSSIKNPLKKKAVTLKSNTLKGKGNKSLFIMYLSTTLGAEYFSNKTSAHGFFTPHKDGLQSLSIAENDIVTHLKFVDSQERINQLYTWLKEFLYKQTYEVGIPVLHDSQLAPKGQSGITISFLFSYELMKYITEIGCGDTCTKWMEQEVINILDENQFPQLKDNVFDRFSATPLTIEKKFNNSEGSTTGWSFSQKIPVESHLWKIAKSVKTPFKDIYQASHWSFSPAGVPTSIINGKIAASKIK